MQVESIAALKAEILAYLSRQNSFRDVKLMEEYPAEKRTYPQKMPLLVAGVDAVGVAQNGLGRYRGEETERVVSVFGRDMEITMRFDLLCPPESGGSTCHRLWEALCEALVDEDCPLPFNKIRCGALEYDKSFAANRLTVYADICAVLSRSDLCRRIEEFDVRRV